MMSGTALSGGGIATISHIPDRTKKNAVQTQDHNFGSHS